MGKKFNTLCGEILPIDLVDYLTDRGFTIGIMGKRNNDDNKSELQLLKEQVPCFHKISKLPNKNIFEIYISLEEMYYEVYSVWSVNTKSGHYTGKDFDTVEKLDTLLDVIYDSII